jgi:predicted phage baseplate assembly protein
MSTPPNPCSCQSCTTASPSLNRIENRPGLPAISYRIGTQPQFLDWMISQIQKQQIPSGQNQGGRPLSALTTRRLDDPAIALIDAWACVADVLTFYQERIANEGFLRTATERISVLQLAREIGYELNPGVAASTYLAFTIQAGNASQSIFTVPKGTKVQSVPPQGKTAQTFETIEDIEARPEWNALTPVLGFEQSISPTMNPIWVAGTATNLRAGDRLMILTSDQNGTLSAVVMIVQTVSGDSKNNRTRVDVLAPPSPTLRAAMAISLAGGFSQAQFANPGGIPLNEGNVAQAAGQNLDAGKFNSLLNTNRWSGDDLAVAISNLAANRPPTTDAGVYAFRSQAGFFGNNAPAHASLLKASGAPLYPVDWDGSAFTVWDDPRGDTVANWADADVYLERSIPGMLAGSWIVFEVPGTTHGFFRVNSNSEASLAAFGMSGKASALRLNSINGQAVASGDKSSSYLLRKTTTYAQSEKLTLTETPDPGPLNAQSTQITLQGVIPYLQVGQAVALSGTLTFPTIPMSEILIISGISYQGNTTVLTFASAIQNTYQLATVALNANVARATHGETTKEVLGSGDASQNRQKFVLKKPPLTYVPAATPSGAVSTLEVRVNNLSWEESDSLYGLNSTDPNYIVRREDDGTTSVTFGDSAARLPTGSENVIATYRSGIGPDGEVDSGTLTLLQSKPLGVRSAVNPVAATGSAGPENIDDARGNAPLRVLTLDRIVSLEDYEDFARSFSGIGKASAIAVWAGETRLVHLTVGAASGQPVDPSSLLYNYLSLGIDAVRDPVQVVRIDTFLLLQFNVTATVKVAPRYVADDVIAAVTAALQQTFSFLKRNFAQPVSAAEVMLTIQNVVGVIASDLSRLYKSDDPEGPSQIEPAAYLLAEPAHWDGSKIVPAELLLINSAGIAITELKT